MFCPICLNKNIQNEVIKLGELCYVCRDEFCTFCMKAELFENKKSKLFDLSENSRKQQCDISQNLSLEIDIVMNANPVNIVNVNYEENSNQAFKNLSNNFQPTIFEVGKKLKTNMENENSFEKYSILNWLRMPLLKVQSKIMCFLLLHMEVFELDDNEILKKIKEEYSLINKLATLFTMDLIVSLCYNFISKLSSLSNTILVDKQFNGEIEEQILNMFNNYFMKMYSKTEVKCKYSVLFDCRTCNVVDLKSFENYIITIPYCKFYFKITKKEISYQILCPKCFRKAKIVINVINIPKFLIIHNENGSKERINLFDSGFRIRNDSFPLIGIIELGKNYPKFDVKENYRMDFQQYLNSINGLLTKRPVTNSDHYVIHYRHQNSWFSMSENGPRLCSPTNMINTTNGLSPCFLIYGKPSTNQIIDNQFNLEEFFHNFELENDFDLTSFALNKEKWSRKILQLSNLSDGESSTELLKSIDRSNLEIRLVKLNLSKFLYDEVKDCYIIEPFDKCSDSVSISSDVDSVVSIHSIHSKSTASEFTTDSDCDWMDIYRKSESISTYIKEKTNEIHIEPKNINYSISSSGFSSANSSVAGTSVMKNQLPFKSLTTSSSYSDSYSDCSSTKVTDYFPKKRKIDIDYLIEMKRSKI